MDSNAARELEPLLLVAGALFLAGGNSSICARMSMGFILGLIAGVLAEK